MQAPYRARFIGTQHMAAAGHYLAAQAAVHILEAGGNAIDAGCAGGLALNVLQSDFCSFGGVAPIMVYLADQDKVVTIAGVGCWPRAASLDVIQQDYDGHIPEGILSTVIPAAPDAWLSALEHYGTMSFSDIAESAIRFARDGFPSTALNNMISETYAKGYSRWLDNAEIFLPNGNPPRVGELFKQTDLGNTLQYMVDEEKAARRKGDRNKGIRAARDAFYKGDIASTIIKYHSKNGGWLTMKDLAEYRVEICPPVSGKFGDVIIFSCGPWSQGPVFPQTLQLLNSSDLAQFKCNDVNYIHTVVEALKLSFADRHYLYGDPNFVSVPMEALLSEEYTNERRRLIDPNKANPGMPEPGLRNDAHTGISKLGAANKDSNEDALDTSYICAVDQAGNLFSATPSDASFSVPVIPSLGFAPSGRGTQSWADPTLPNCMAPGKRPRCTPNPAIAMRPNDWAMPFGSPGNDVQVQAMAQVLMNIAIFDMELQIAVESPRFATVSFPRSSEPHSYSPGRLHLESRIPNKIFKGLRKLGHDVAEWPEWEWKAGDVCAIKVDTKTGIMEGAADPRRPSGVAGW